MFLFTKNMVFCKIVTKSRFANKSGLHCTWLLSSGQDFSKKFLDSKHVLKVTFKPSRKNQKKYFYHFLCTGLTQNPPLKPRKGIEFVRDHMTYNLAYTWTLQMIATIVWIYQKIYIIWKNQFRVTFATIVIS